MPTKTHLALEEMIAEASGHAAPLTSLRPDFHKLRGELHADDASWELWSMLFVEWAVCEKNVLPSTTVARWPWESSHRSLFQILRTKGHDVTVTDLAGGGEFELSGVSLAGVAKGTVAEMRLCFCRDAGAVVASPRMLFHPAEVVPLLLKYSRDGGGRHVSNLASKAYARARLQPRAVVRAYERLFVDVLAS